VSIDGAILAERFAAQGLSGLPLSDPVAVAERLLALQGQDPRGFRLAVRARTEGLTVAAVEQALGEDRTLVVTWLNRGTLHLVRSEDYPWLQTLTVPPLFTSSTRRLRQEGVSELEAERALATIEQALSEEGPLTRAKLRERLESADVRTDGQATIHLLFLAALRGVVVRGPMDGKQQAYVLVRDWLGNPQPIDRDAALAELARRYLIGHAPATDRDLARWAGLPLRDARAGLKAIGSELVEDGDGLLRLTRRRPRPRRPPQPRLLGAFDPVLLGWTSRQPILGKHEPRVVSGGLFRPFALAGGRAVAGWRWRKDEVELEPFERLRAEAAVGLELDAADVARFLTPG
jgi:winged helix DNA-binding protein